MTESRLMEHEGNVVVCTDDERPRLHSDRAAQELVTAAPYDVMVGKAALESPIDEYRIFVPNHFQVTEP